MLGGPIGDSLPTKAGQRVDIVLTCDPPVIATSSTAERATYLETGEGLPVPPGATVIGLRVLSEDELGECFRLAGRVSRLGEIVAKHVGEQMDALKKDDEGEVDQDEANRVELNALAQLSAEERQALAYHDGRQLRLRQLVLNACLQSVSTCPDFEPGRAGEWLKTISPNKLRSEVFHELCSHAFRISTPGSRGKPSGPPSG